MRKILSLLITATALCALGLNAATVKESFRYNDTTRTYSIYIPDNATGKLPIIIYTHGYGSKTRERADLNAAAERHGYAVCYPDGTPDTKGRCGWNVGYPSQSNMTVDEADFLRALTADAADKFHLDQSTAFLTGMSNGGDLCYQIAYTAPTLFKAYASVAGLTFTWMYLANKLSAPVPFMEIHGTADKTSMWNGDPENDGGWGAYLPVPMAVAAIACNNRCTALSSEPLADCVKSDKKITRHSYTGAPGNADVTLVEIEGGKHSWANGDIDTGELICRFFNNYR